MRRLWFIPSVTLCFACSSEPLPSGHYRITLGQETDTYTLPPPAVKYTVSSMSATDANAALTEIVASDIPIDSIEVPPTGTNWYTLQAVDADGIRRVQATSFAVSGITMAGYDYPLFAARTDAFCRPPGTLVTAQGERPPTGLVWGRYLWILGASSLTTLTTDSYDLVGWGEAAAGTAENSFTTVTCTQQPCKFESFATYAYYDSSSLYQFALGIGADWAKSFNVYDGTTQDVTRPSGLSSWSDLSGGRTLTSYAGAVYIVGATRSSADSNAVLEISTATNSGLAIRPLIGQRKGAAATYIENRGVVVVGGSAADSTAAGIEVLAPGGDRFTALPYPPDSVQGAALVAENSASSTIVWRIGGRSADGTPAPSVAYDLACTQDCQVQAIPALDVDVATAIGFFYQDNHIVVGEQADGSMVAWRVTATGTTPIPQRQPRRAASAVQLPNGFVALVGGKLISDGSDALSLEVVAF
jgi:hypothetical protein